MDDVRPLSGTQRPTIAGRRLRRALAIALLALPQSVFPAGESLWVVPTGFGKAGHSTPGVIITRMGASADLSSAEGAIVALKQFASSDVAFIQLNDIPDGRFKFKNFKTFGNPGKFEAFLGGYLNDNGFRTVLDLSHPGARLESGHYAAHLRARRLSELYGVDVISFDPVALFVYETTNVEALEFDRWHQIGTTEKLITDWIQLERRSAPPTNLYTYYPHGNIGQFVQGLQEETLDATLHPGLVWTNPYKGAGDFVRIWSQDDVYREYSSSLFARLTQGGQESPIALEAAVERLFGSQLTRIGPRWRDRLRKGENPDSVYFTVKTTRPDDIMRQSLRGWKFPSRRRRR